MKRDNTRSRALFVGTRVVLSALALVGRAFIPGARADETCSSPYLARIEGQEEFVYVWTLGVEGLGDGSDKLVVVDVKPDSTSYGKVIYTGYNGAFGLVVIIDHGNSLATMYAHLSRVFVSPGQAVRTLQSIAASGSTGWSTGPHLHFQVDLQGQPVNPMSWL